MPASTFPAALAEQLRADAARPLVTFYDDATGERVELSVATYANWVAKTAGLLQDELDVERGGSVVVDLPTHWLGAVWLGAAWSLGLRVGTGSTATSSADVVVCGPDGIEEYAGSAPTRSVVALSLRPMAARFAEALPTGVVDYSAVVLGQPDAFVATDPPGPDDVAWSQTDTRTQRELLDAARDDAVVAPGGRLLTDVNPVGAAGLRTLLGPLLAGGGTVWVRHPDPDGWTRRQGSERATATIRA